jgi:DNA-binding XRE family transcriptional regulator
MDDDYIRRYYQGAGWRCAVLRQRAGLDQREAAKRAGVALSTWQRVESGRRCQTMTYLKIGLAFPCSLDWFVGGQAVAS